MRHADVVHLGYCVTGRHQAWVAPMVGGDIEVVKMWFAEALVGEGSDSSGRMVAVVGGVHDGGGSDLVDGRCCLDAKNRLASVIGWENLSTEVLDSEVRRVVVSEIFGILPRKSIACDKDIPPWGTECSLSAPLESHAYLGHQACRRERHQATEKRRRVCS